MHAGAVITSFMSDAALAQCPAKYSGDMTQYQKPVYRNSVVWNEVVVTMLRTTIKGLVWCVDVYYVSACDLILRIYWYFIEYDIICSQYVLRCFRAQGESETCWPNRSEGCLQNNGVVVLCMYHNISM